MMKRFLHFRGVLRYVIFSLLFTCFLHVRAEVNDDCFKFIHISNDTIVTLNADGWGEIKDVPTPGSFGNPGTRPDPYPDLGTSGNRGCLLNREIASNWYLIPIKASGDFEFIFGADSTQWGYYDWALWKYDKYTTCDDIANNLVAPVRCNYNIADYGGTGIAGSIPNDGHRSNYESPLEVEAGDFYILCIDNAKKVKGNVSIKFSGSADVGFRDPTPIKILGDTVLCEGETGMIYVKGGGLTSLYSWDTGEMSDTIYITPESTTFYTVNVRSVYGKKVLAMDTVNITVNPNPEPDMELLPINPPYTLATNIKFEDKSNTSQGEINDWLWDFGDGTYSTNQSPVHIFSDTGKFEVKQIIYNDLGCSDTAKRILEIKPAFDIFIPTVFSPNNDGLNDKLEVFGIGITEYEMRIYNQWGSEIFVSFDQYHQWNGRKHNVGRIVPDGVYVYIVSYKAYDGRNERIDGYTTIRK